jgi:hypothetical protein
MKRDMNFLTQNVMSHEWTTNDENRTYGTPSEEGHLQTDPPGIYLLPPDS